MSPLLPVLGSSDPTCRGACCAAFSLSGGMDTYRGLQDGSITERHEFGMVRVKDILVPITAEEAAERLKMAGGMLDGWPEWRSDHLWMREGGQLFTCSKWDPGTKLCTVYDQRPEMCRSYEPKHCRLCKTREERGDVE